MKAAWNCYSCMDPIRSGDTFVTVDVTPKSTSNSIAYRACGNSVLSKRETALNNVHISIMPNTTYTALS